MDYSVCRRILFSLKPETAHRLVTANLNWLVHFGLNRRLSKLPAETPVRVMGLRFPNPIGLAAGMEKDGSRVSAWGGLGFGFVEVGTVTPHGTPAKGAMQAFRLIPDEALIHRGNGETAGLDSLMKNLRSADPFLLRGGILGINIAKAPATPAERALDDYELCLERLKDTADFIVLAPGILQLPNLETVLAGIAKKRDELAVSGRRIPVALKLPADLPNEKILRIADLLIKTGIDGVVATGISLSLRESLTDKQHADEPGALSGAPLANRSTEVIRLIVEHSGDKLDVIASGGIMSGKDAIEKVQAGAKLVELHTGLIYKGPALISECSEALLKERTLPETD